MLNRPFDNPDYSLALLEENKDGIGKGLMDN